MTLRRVLVVGGLVVGSLALAAPAMADDLEDYLDRAAEADYAGTRVVVTVWEGRSIAEMTHIEHSDDVVMLGAAGSEAVIAAGKATPNDGTGIALPAWATPAVSDKYAVGAVNDVRRLGRDAHAIEIMEDGVMRARIVFDIVTWAPLVTEIYGGDGELFRIASFTEFDSYPTRVYERMPDEGHDYDLVDRIDRTSLPRRAGDYERLDIYAGADGMAHVFYSDGLFSFSVFEVAPDQVRNRFAGAGVLTVDESDYLLLVRPSELWVAWVRGTTAYVLVGDLPPDHLERVLSELPDPKRRNLLERLLGLFG